MSKLDIMTRGDMHALVDGVVNILKPHFEEEIRRQIWGEVRHVVRDELKQEIHAAVREMVREKVNIGVTVEIKENV